jgi:hypothetical protein
LLPPSGFPAKRGRHATKATGLSGRGHRGAIEHCPTSAAPLEFFDLIGDKLRGDIRVRRGVPFAAGDEALEASADVAEVAPRKSIAPVDARALAPGHNIPPEEVRETPLLRLTIQRAAESKRRGYRRKLNGISSLQ